jgi:tryptophan-rich sensory protein
VFTILSSTFLFALDNTIVADVQSPIVEQFGEAGKLAWLGVAFVLSGSSTIITWYAGDKSTDLLWLMD